CFPFLHERFSFIGQVESLCLGSGFSELPCKHCGVFWFLGLRADRTNFLDFHRFRIVQSDPSTEGDRVFVVEPPHLTPLCGQNIDSAADFSAQCGRCLVRRGQRTTARAGDSKHQLCRHLPGSRGCSRGGCRTCRLSLGFHVDTLIVLAVFQRGLLVVARLHTFLQLLLQRCTGFCSKSELYLSFE